MFEDQLIYQSSLSGIKLARSPIDCEAYLLDYYSSSQFDTGFGCSNSFIKNQCCNACQSKAQLHYLLICLKLNSIIQIEYLDYDCFDTFATCDSLSQYCNTQDIITKACPKTCKLCKSKRIFA